jgi:hypothetical protein
LRAYEERITKLENNGVIPQYIFSAFCPTTEPCNCSKDIIQNTYSDSKVVVILIEYKWCSNSKLLINEIKQQYSELTNIEYYILSEKDAGRKIIALQKIVMSCL